MQISYRVDGAPVSVDVEGARIAGTDRVIASDYNDPLRGRPWYPQGYTVAPLFSAKELAALRDTLAGIICNALSVQGIATEGFTLERYHDFATDDAHAKLITQTRRLSHSQIGLEFDALLARLSALAGTDLTIYNPLIDQEHWVICRIYRPLSLDFNPVHKDIYEVVDAVDVPLRMVNFWIPICGVGGATGLPVAAGSHLLREDQIERVRAGATMNGVKYNVSAVTRWNGESSLTSVIPNPGEVMCFSSHVEHGLARNLNPDTTRISLEFRLFAK